MDWRHAEELLAAGRDVYGELKNLCVWVKPDLDSRTGFRHREWQKCWRLIRPGQKCGAKL
jgi:hypothetical protein